MDTLRQPRCDRNHRDSPVDLLIVFLLSAQCLIGVGALVTHHFEFAASFGALSLFQALAYPVPASIVLLVFVIGAQRILQQVLERVPALGAFVGIGVTYGLIAGGLYVGARALGLEDFDPWALVGGVLGIHAIVRLGPPVREDPRRWVAFIPGAGLGLIMVAVMQWRYKLWQSMSDAFLNPNAVLLTLLVASAAACGIALWAYFVPRRAAGVGRRWRFSVSGALFVGALMLVWINRVELVPRQYIEVHLALCFVEWILLVGAVGWFRSAVTFRALGPRLRVVGNSAALLLSLSSVVALTATAPPLGEPVPHHVDDAARLFSLLLSPVGDRDGDSFLSVSLGGRDCDDSTGDIHPLAREVPGNGVDETCSGTDLDVHDARPPLVASANGPTADLTIVVTIDMVRPDFMGVYGSDDDTTPFLSRTSEEWVRFDRAYSSGGITTLGLASLLIGRLPLAIEFDEVFRTPDYRYVFPDERDDDDLVNRTFLAPRNDPHVTLAALFGEAGRESIAIVDDGPGGSFQKGMGYERGFTEFYYPNEPEGPGEANWGREQVTEQALESIEQAPKGSLLWLHYYDPHNAVGPCEHFEPTRGLGCYRDAIHDVDQSLGEIATRLRALGRWEESAILVSSDHGEALGEHGLSHHGLDSFEEFVHIPLLAKFPGGRWDHPVHFEEPVSLIDVTATAAAVAGLELPLSFQGEDLRALLEGRTRRHPVMSQLLLLQVDATPYRQQTLLVDGDTRLMFDRVTGRGWLTDLATDPRQRTPLTEAVIGGERRSLSEAFEYGLRQIEALEAR